MEVRYRILSLDGGGIRGLLTSRLLERIDSARPGVLGSVDLLAGTSTGAILALALAAGLHPRAISNLYVEHGDEVFAENLWDLTDVDRLVRADYRNQALKRALTKLFGTRTFGDLPKSALVATFDLDSETPTKDGVRSWKPKFFHNFDEPGSHDRDELVVDVAMRACAAPTYFPIYQGFIDGGVVANNPSMCALAQALHDDTGGQSVSYVALLSVGTGVMPRWVESLDGDWGYTQWAKPVLEIAFEGGSGIADYECRQILGRRYLRLNPVLTEPIGLDAVDRIPDLERIAAHRSLDDELDWLDSHFVSAGESAG